MPRPLDLASDGPPTGESPCSRPSQAMRQLEERSSRGLAVVAEEVRKPAEESQQARAHGGSGRRGLPADPRRRGGCEEPSVTAVELPRLGAAFTLG